jgi:hypothetical protein
MSLAGDIQGRDMDDESRFTLVRFDDGLNDLRLVVRRIVDCGEDEQASLIKRSRTSRSMVKRCSSIVHLNPLELVVYSEHHLWYNYCVWVIVTVYVL